MSLFQTALLSFTHIKDNVERTLKTMYYTHLGQSMSVLKLVKCLFSVLHITNLKRSENKSESIGVQRYLVLKHGQNIEVKQ